MPDLESMSFYCSLGWNGKYDISVMAIRRKITSVMVWVSKEKFSLHGKQLTLSIVNNKTGAYKQKQDLENLYLLPQRAWNSFLIFILPFWWDQVAHIWDEPLIFVWWHGAAFIHIPWPIFSKNCIVGAKLPIKVQNAPVDSNRTVPIKVKIKFQIP